jgi:hypothetical protein
MRACIKPHIWSATPNNQQADHPPTSIKQIMIISNSSVHRPIDHPQANDGLLTTRPYRSTFKTDPTGTLVDGYTGLVTDRIQDEWTCHLMTILFSQLPGPRSHRMKDEVLRMVRPLIAADLNMMSAPIIGTGRPGGRERRMIAFRQG